jgi:hypothetical protein
VEEKGKNPRCIPINAVKPVCLHNIYRYPYNKKFQGKTLWSGAPLGAVSPDLERNKLPSASQQMLLMMFHYKA